jgi:KaiC/GvpD/RAD55 family RecA-like ATPase
MRKMVLLVGSPGAGKSTICHQVVLNGFALERPVIFVTTDNCSSEVIDFLRESAARVGVQAGDS